MVFRFIDLFAGIGGLRLAFEKVGGECVFSCEIDKNAQHTYEVNFGERPYGDIRDIDEKDIPDHDILLGGFPLQGFSLEGKSIVNNGNRELIENLFFEIARILKAKQPKAFLLETVKGLLSHQRGEMLGNIIRVLSSLGYEVNYKVINAKGLVPQHKERMYIVGFREKQNFEFPSFPQNGPYLKSILEEFVDDKYTLSNEKWKSIQDRKMKLAMDKAFCLADKNSHIRSLIASRIPINHLISQEGKNPRKLTPREYARLQGFPESFIIPLSDAVAYRQFSNSSVVPVIRMIAEAIIQVLKSNKSIRLPNVAPYRSKKGYIKEIIDIAEKYGSFYTKFLAANDLGSNEKSNQAGVYISKKAGLLFFDNEGKKGELISKTIKVYLPYQNHPIESMVKWYGSKNEYRITRFWTKTEYNREEQYGNLLILIKIGEDTFICHILDNDDDIEKFIAYFKLNLTNNSDVFGLEKPTIISDKQSYILDYSRSLNDFPSTVEIASKAREIWFNLNGKINHPDSALLDWIHIEYEIFKSIEVNLYQEYINEPFGNMDNFIQSANSVINRRKSRAGKSFEHHVDYLLKKYDIPFNHPGLSEDNKKPDFIMPSNILYADKSFPNQMLTFLGAKTTCKDRWRQILNEADRIKDKHLITLQQGISVNQLEEMKKHNVILVVPQNYVKYYPERYQNDLLTITKFLRFLKEKYRV